ncbi:MAG TPA: copper chaperone PCu(A)C [Candidatus Limnocylindrales bacterium]|nr:copper chaperone PCu(A)C [Candidatus Limnocylindrales bacterium]
MRRVASLLAVAGLAAVTLGACGGGATNAPSAATPVISDAWVRPPMGADRPAAGYLTITNPGAAADALVGVSSPVAMSCEIHETSMDSSGMAGMQPIDRLEIPAGGTVRLEPGGYHLMLMESQAMTVGSTVELRLEFETAGTVVVQAEVREG